MTFARESRVERTNTGTPERVLAGARIVSAAGVVDGWVGLRRGEIVQVGTGRPPAHAPIEDLQGAWLLPGFVDLHMHGGGGADAASSATAMRQAVRFHRGHGTTRTLVSLVAAPVRDLCEQMGWVADLATQPRSRRLGVLGTHLEGPFLASAQRGAQDPAHLLTPDMTIAAKLLAASQGTLRSMTIAPELPGALDVVAYLCGQGVVAAIGHSDATYQQAMAAIDAGASLATHLFNGMRKLHHREPGIVGAVLDSGVAAELINDGVHLHSAAFRLAMRDLRQPVLVTDAVEASGMAEGRYSLGGRALTVRGGEARLSSNGSLAGSTLTMDAAVRRSVSSGGLSLQEASVAASGNPARVLGLDHRIGAIAPGPLGDFVVLGDDLHVVRVMSAGVWVGGNDQVTDVKVD